jgi:hypothetical protein
VLGGSAVACPARKTTTNGAIVDAATSPSTDAAADVVDAAAAADPADPAAPAAPGAAKPLPPGFWKGQLHAHSSASDDSNTPPAEVHRWYEQRGYDFIVFTDHNAVTDTEDARNARTWTFPGVELTRNLPRCEPPTESSCSLHMSSLFVDASSSTNRGRIDLGELKSIRRRDVYLDELARAEALGGIAMLCHPNLLFSGPNALTIHDLARQGLRLMEIRNEAWDSANEGDATHPSTEALWDAVLTRGGRIFATATDDAHHYRDAALLRARGERPFDGDHGFVVVHAPTRDAPSLRRALLHGDFYASTGLVLERYELSASGKALILETRSGERVTFEIIHRGGVARREEGSRLELALTPEDGPYVRVRIRDRSGATAWTQPIFRD